MRASTSNGIEARALAGANDAAWLLARRELVGAIGAWRELDANLSAEIALARDITAADRALAEHARKRDALTTQLASAKQEHQHATARLEDARREAAAYQQKRGLSLDAARRQEDEARRRSAELDKLVAIAAEARGAATARAELERQLADLTLAAANDEKLRRTQDGEREAATLLRDERARVVEELRKAAGLSHARAELVEGDPCPLCGATEHPWHSRGSFDALIVDAQARLAEATARGDASRAALATLAARDQQRVVERGRLTSCLATADATAKAATLRWREQLASLGELPLVDEPSIPSAQQLAAERVEAARSKLEAARAARSGAEAAANAANEAQARIQGRQADVEHHAHKLRELEANLAQVDALAERVRGERASKLTREHELVTSIAEGLARWRTSCALSSVEQRAIAEAYAQVAPTALATHAAAGAKPTAAAARRDGAEPTAAAARGDGAEPSAAAAPRDGAEPSAAGARRDGAELPAALERARRVLADVVAMWAKHADVVAELDGALVVAISHIDDQAREHERVLVAARTALTGATSRREVLRGELQEAAARLEAARATAGFDREELQRLLSTDAARADELAEQLDTLERAADRARTLVAERRRLVDDHAAIETADPQARADAARVEQLAAAVDAADHHAATLAAALAADADARARRAAAQAELAAAEQAAEIDRVLGEVIGSHDGKAFRSFAQSLTLDGLLAVANSHLEELAPRYQLERVPKHDLEIQVIDRDLGDEIRGVQSLSGGESFLVSLALALGLSSMSAHDVRVRTLLIDEGFGTLDPATLDSALAVLDALQATGRQVGVISHVPALVERVRAHVRVSPKGGGRSEVVVAEA